MASRKSRKKARPGDEIGGYMEGLVLLLDKYSIIITIILLLLIISIGTYVRIIPALNYGIELDASDPWIVYWETKYFHEHGLFNFEGLKHVDLFWWPRGRNFLTSEYLGTAWLAAATYPLGAMFGLTLKEWLALFPVFAGVASIVLSFVFVYRVTGSKLAGLVASTFFAFFPGAITRTTVGFVEKIAIAIPFILLFLIFMFEALKRLSEAGRLDRVTLIHSVLAGLFGGLVAFFWGGFLFVIIVYSLIVLFDPIASRPSLDRLKAYLVTGIVMIAIMIASPKIGVRFFVANLGAAVPAVLVLYAAEAYLAARRIDERIFRRGVDYRVQLWILSIVAVLGIIAIQAGIVGTNNLRYVAALGIRHISPLVESIQENQPTSFQALLREYGIAFLLGLAGFIVFIVRSATTKTSPFYRLSRAVIYFMMFFALFINKQLAYFTQISSFFNVIAGGVAVADLTLGGIGAVSALRARAREIVDPMKVMAAIFIVIVVALSGIYYGHAAYTQNRYRAPQILTSGLGALRMGDEVVVPLNRAWLDAFVWIRNNTREDAVIVSWWDYGYWITVNTGRRTVADGVTFNETQIRWLAEILTGNESTAVYLLRKFNAEPGNTYIVFYEVFQGIFDMRNGNVTIMYPMIGSARKPQGISDVGIIVHGGADFGKSIQMLKIAYRVDPFDPLVPFNTIYSSEYVDQLGYRYKHFPGFVGKPEKNVTKVLSTLIYQMAFNAIPRIKDIGIFDNPRCAAIFDNSTLVMPYVVASLSGNGQLSPQPVIPPPMKYFKPVAVSVGCPIIKEDAQRGVTTFTAVLVFIYQWTTG